MEPERVIAELEARARDLAARSAQAQEQIRHASATVRAKDGAVSVTVAPNGAVQAIEFSPKAGELSHVQLGQVVMGVLRQAQAQAARQVAAVLEPDFGGTQAMEFLTGFIPVEEVEEPPAREREEGSVLRDESWGAGPARPGYSAPPTPPAPPARRPADRGEPDEDDGFGPVLR
ncbi:MULTISPECIES: YbaB/EbfC family nucleoid-associated protein [Actinosynnema]|uniref:YbaB/EbfC family nucleoid-associated protein n=1 Tax=Actinosynnema TaxID=40566 RepID=UPI0020A5B651|nr:YbaB/EbfC family nucleoid-associated protein [Actinosynnema pretiosum]MCP2097921.1 YbaB/EbfC DNA-binding family protein [Actinosynnema pretiosum]